MKRPTLVDAVITRFAEIGLPKIILETERAVFDACYKAFAQRGWIFVFDRRAEPPVYVALPATTPASFLYRIPKV